MHFPFRREPSRGLTLRRFALFPVTVLILALTGLPSGATGVTPVPEVQNPDLEMCGIDFVLILDRSGSIETAGAEELVQGSAMAFLNALKDRGSTASLVTFAQDATRDVDPIALTQASIDASFGPMVAGLKPAVGPDRFGGSTNWQDALQKAREQHGGFPGMSPDLVVMITDGNPTWNNLDGNDGSQTNGGDLPLAVVESDAIKLAGTHMFAVGVGGTQETPLSEDNLMAISGPDQFDGTPPPDMTTADWTRVLVFEELQGRLQAIAASLCSGNVIVEKTMDGKPAAGWTFDAGAQTPPTPASGTTGPDGKTGFSYAFKSAEDEPAATTITERPQNGAALDSASCVDKAKQGDDKGVGTFKDGGMDLQVRPGQTINCTFKNVSVADTLVPGIKIEKAGPAQAHEGDTVTYGFKVTNTGETTLENIAVTDDKLGAVGTVPSLAPGASTTLTKDYTVLANQVADVVNQANACAAGSTDAAGQPLCAQDQHTMDVLHPAITIDKTANPLKVAVPDAVTFTYVVKNTGDTPLSGLVVTDDKLGNITTGVIGAGETQTFTKTINVSATTPGRNVGTATATDPLGRSVTASDPADIEITQVLGIQEVNPAVLPITGAGAGLRNVLIAVAAIMTGGLLLMAGRRRRTA